MTYCDSSFLVSLLLPGDFFHPHAAALAARFREGIPVIMDLTAVNFLDSSGLGAIVAVMKLLAPARRLELAGLTPAVEKVFRLTRMVSVFTIHPDVARGLGATG